MVEPVRVLIVDDHEMVREGLCLLLGEAEEIVVVGQAGTAQQALAQAQALQPDVILLDMVLPDGDGVEVLRGLRGGGKDQSGPTGGRDGLPFEGRSAPGAPGGDSCCCGRPCDTSSRSAGDSHAPDGNAR